MRVRAAVLACRRVQCTQGTAGPIAWPLLRPSRRARCSVPLYRISAQACPVGSCSQRPRSQWPSDLAVDRARRPTRVPGAPVKLSQRPVQCLSQAGTQKRKERGALTSPDNAELTRRARNLVEFLRRLTQMRTSPVRDVGEYEDVVWFASMPDMSGSHCVTHDGTRRGRRLDRDRATADSTAAAAARCLWGWLVDDANPPPSPHCATSTRARSLPDNVVAAYDDYLDAWRDWIDKYGPRVPLLALYERLFRIKQQADQLGERYETVVAAGLALVPEAEHGRIRRHLVTMRAEVHYEPQTGRITVRPARGRDRSSSRTRCWTRASSRPKSSGSPCMPALERPETDIWVGAPSLTRSRRGRRRCATTRSSTRDSTSRRCRRRACSSRLAPALILRKRTPDRSSPSTRRWTSSSMPGRSSGPCRGTGGRARWRPSGRWPGADLVRRGRRAVLPEAVQRRAARCSPPADDVSDGVVVVGPPGTGKSHTIANLVSHLLAHGQRVLVTSHTSRALEVLLDKLPDEIRSLSVSLVGDGRAGMRELQRSVERARQPLHGRRVADIEDRPADQPVSGSSGSAHTRSDGATWQRSERSARATRRCTSLALAGYRGTLSQIAAQIADERDAFGWASDMAGEAPAPHAMPRRRSSAVLARVDLTADARPARACRSPICPRARYSTELCSRIADLEAAVAAAAESRR